MSRAIRSTPLLFALLAVGTGAFVLGTGALPEPYWRVAIVIAGVVAAVIGWRVNRLPLLFAAAMALAAGRLSGLHVEDVFAGSEGVHWHHAISDTVVSLALTAMLGLVLWRRYGRARVRDVVDMAIIVIGAAMIAWLIVAQPLIDDFDVGPGLALLSAAYLPASALLATFLVDLTCTGLQRNRTMQLVTVAALANVGAAIVGMLQLVGSISVDTNIATVTVYVMAYLLMCAGLAHRDAPATLERDHASRPTDTLARLSVMALSVLVPLALIASVPPSSNLDLVVRLVGTLALALAVVIRLRMAMSDHTRVQQALIRQLSRDELTGLPTRTRFVELVADALERTWRSDTHPTIIQLNLDRFKNINDSLGHYDANQVLVLVSDRLRDTAASFGGTAARAGGDDFVVMDDATQSTDEAMARADAIRDALAAPFHVGESTVFVTASIGVAVAPRSQTLTAEELLRRADIATHRAKADGRNRVALFDDSMQANLAQRMDVEHALHGAIGRQEMRLYYQPIVNLVTGEIGGFEALMRWRRSEDNLVPPVDFIPIAEETGVICELGAWALDEALTSLRSWVGAGIVPPDTTMSVNVSPRQIADPNFSHIVQDVLESTGTSPSALWLEMTESMMLEEPELAQTTLQSIREMGVKLALDDFGTGFSSLSLLQQFPIDRIKIDRAFVQGIGEEGNDRSLVRTIIAMADSMELDLVAEGVETIQQLECLRDHGCAKAQGYLISRPVPPDAMRSTMVAIGELASLSLFGMPNNDATRPGEERAPAANGTPTPAPVMVGAPIGAMSSRPLGQPML